MYALLWSKVRPFVVVVAVACVVVLVMFVAVVAAATAAAKTLGNSRADTLPEGVGDPLSRAAWPQFCGWSAWVVVGLRLQQKPQVELKVCEAAIWVRRCQRSADSLLISWNVCAVTCLPASSPDLSRTKIV